jgi:ATP-dependent RNA helicase RhlE
MSFEELELIDPLLKAISDQGYKKPTDIQKEAIPFILNGRDLVASSQTGTGKTACFALPILQKIYLKKEDNVHRVKALVLTPTRELALQVSSSISGFARHLGLKSIAIFGGVDIKPQIERLHKGVDIATATPGRLIDLIRQKKINLKDIDTLVLDEADRMLDMGFIEDIKTILNKISPKRQTLMFSATYSTEIKYIAKTFQKNPAYTSVSQENSTVDKVRQSAYILPKAHKTSLLIHLILSEKWRQALIFAPTKFIADRLVEKLCDQQIIATAIHSDKTQANRLQILNDFKERKINILVATDIAARGLDINNLPIVVNYELPSIHEDYVHRIGRTARAGKTGEAIALVGHEEKITLRKIERYINMQITVNKMPLYAVQKGSSPKQQADSGRKNKAKHNKSGHQTKNKSKAKTLPKNAIKKKKNKPPVSRKENPFHKKK